jgi:hypothetical protein
MTFGTGFSTLVPNVLIVPQNQNTIKKTTTEQLHKYSMITSYLGQ